MEFIPVKTRAFLPPKDNLFSLLDHSLPKLQEKDVIFITSKILGISQGRCIKIDEVDKQKLIQHEADYFVKKPVQIKNTRIYLTIKDNTLIPSSGIDESNGNGYYVLWPKNTNSYLKKIHTYLRKKHKIKNLGIISTDSHTTPLRWGVTGISTGFFGLEPLKDLRGKKDIFGVKLQYTQVNIIDALSSMAVLLMGESAERTPILIGRKLPMVKFTNKNTYKKMVIPKEKDIYRVILKPFIENSR